VENYYSALVSHSGTCNELNNTQRLKMPWKGTILSRIITVYLIPV